MRNHLLYGLLMAVPLTISTTANAADPMADGNRFTMSIGMGSKPNMTPSLPDGPMTPPAPSGPMMSNRIGAVLGPVVAFGTLGMYSGGDHLDGDTRSSRVYVPGVGLRYHFSPMVPKKASPYVVATAYTKKLQSDVESDLDRVFEDVKRQGFSAGFGGEYAFAGACSVAGEVGLAHDIARYDEDGMEWMQVSTTITSTVLLNFYF